MSNQVRGLEGGESNYVRVLELRLNGGGWMGLRLNGGIS